MQYMSRRSKGQSSQVQEMKKTEHDEMSLAESKETTLVFHNSNFIDGLQSSFKIRPVKT